MAAPAWPVLSGRPGALRRRAPLGPDLPVSRHPARASPDGVWTGRSAGPRPWWQLRCMRRGSASSGVPWSHTTSIVLRVVASQCSHSRGVCGRSSTGVSVLRQIAQRPSWTRWSHWAVWLIGRGVLCRRRAQYSASAGSSGDAPCLTVWWRTMLVQANLCMNAPLVRSPNTHRSCLALLNLAKYRAVTQDVDLFAWLKVAHL